MNHRAGYLYLAGLVSFVAPTGIQTVLFPWLVVVLLQETPERLARTDEFAGAHHVLDYCGWDFR